MNAAPYQGWENGAPPRSWKRLLSMDVGGATANALEWAALDPESQCLVFYDEVHKITTDMRLIASLALPKMKPNGSQEEYDFLAKIGDYENRVALDDMARHGIRFTNAVKQNKIASVHRLAGYLHQNEKRPYPSWHPRAGELGSPLMFITPACKNLITEIPLQKWKNDTKGSSVKDELDRTVKHDALDCALYIARILPAPATIPIPIVREAKNGLSLQSQMYWEAVAERKKSQSGSEPRKAYNPNHNSGGIDLCKSLLGFSL